MNDSGRLQFLSLAVLLLAAAVLGGCLYPQERRLENQVPHTVYLESTQQAVERYQKEQGVLPIVTKQADTPIFEKYEIDFPKLIPKYLPDIPANAFEKGGVYKYVLIDVETKPTVRLIDIRVVNKVATVQQAVARYLVNHGKLPSEKELGNGYYTINFSLISLQVQQVESPVTNQFLPFVMNAKGEVGIDYSLDIVAVLKNAKAEVPKDTDPRYVMARESLFVPIKSFPYTLVNGEPQLLKLG